jgi:hypothetical protein
MRKKATSNNKIATSIWPRKICTKPLRFLLAKAEPPLNAVTDSRERVESQRYRLFQAMVFIKLCYMSSRVESESLRSKIICVWLPCVKLSADTPA